MTKREPARRKRQTTRPEPALVRGVIVAVLGVLTTLGVGWAADVDRDTITAVAGAVTLVLPLVQAWWTRRAVVPAESTLAYVDGHGVPVAGEAAAEQTAAPLHARVIGGDAYLITRVP